MYFQADPSPKYPDPLVKMWRIRNSDSNEQTATAISISLKASEASSNSYNSQGRVHSPLLYCFTTNNKAKWGTNMDIISSVLIIKDRGSLIACLFFQVVVHYIKIFFLCPVFSFMYFKQCFTKVFTVLFWFEVWNFPPWIYEKPRSCFFLQVLKGEKFQSTNQYKICENFHLVLLFF